MSDEQEIARRLAELRGRYLGDVAAKVALMEALLGQLQQAWDHEALAHMRLMAHRLAGSGATFGYADVSERARALEQLLKPLLNGPAPDVAQLDAIEAALLTLRRLSDQLQGSDAQA